VIHRSFRICAIAVLGVALMLSSAACGTEKVDKGAPDPTDNLTIVVPEKLGDLNVAPSKKATDKLKKAGASNDNYQKDAQVFELRQGKELQAVLQITRLTADARPEDEKFQRSIIGSSVLGGSSISREPTRYGDTLVYKTQQNRQLIFVWFEAKFMEILMVRQDSVTLAQKGTVDVTALVTETTALEPVPA
jgi:hypothetical protein